MFLNILRVRARQGYQTMDYPQGAPPALPGRFAGLPSICGTHCGNCPGHCISACPTEAVDRMDGVPVIDLGRCVFCRECESACPWASISFGKEWRLSSSTRQGLLVKGGRENVPDAMNVRAAAVYGKVFSIRVVSAGGCGACEADTNVLNTLAWDLGRFGIHFAASPRHSDGMILIGPVTRNMAAAVCGTHAAIPAPKFVIAVGACAISGGMYRSGEECTAGKEDIFPVDLFIPGCPPHPLTILDGLLRFLGKIPV